MPHAKNWCDHKPQTVVETERALTLWNFPIHTDKTIQANKSDITIKDHKKNM